MKKTTLIVTAALALAAMTACTEELAVDALTVNSSEISFANAGGTQTISFTTNAAWKATTDANWITLSPAEGVAGDATLTITVFENADYSTRSAKVTVTAGTVQTVFNISQSEPKVFEAGAPITLSSIAQSVNLSINTNEEYEVEIDEAGNSWISIMPFTTKGTPVSQTFSLSVTANKGIQSRTGVVTVKTASDNISYTIIQKSDFTETIFGEAAYLGMAMKIYDNEEQKYLEDYDEFWITLYDEEFTSVRLALNVEAGADPAVFPTGEFVAATDCSHVPGTFSLKSDDESCYTSIFSDSELMIADGEITITREGDIYSIVASLMDENENILNYSYVGEISGLEDRSLAAVSQELSHYGQYSTYFASKANKYAFDFTVSRALNDGDFEVNYVSLYLYVPESHTADEVPIGKYTLAEGNEIQEIEEKVYANGNYNAQPWTFTWSGNNKEENEYGYRVYTEIKDGAEIEITKEDGQYYVSIKAELRSYYNECEWSEDWGCWAYKYDENDNEVVTYGEWFTYEAKIPFVNSLTVKDQAVKIIEDQDLEFSGSVDMLPSYIGMWFGDSYSLGGNVFIAGWSSGVDGIYSVYFTFHSKEDWTFEANFGSNCSNPIPDGTYTFTKTKPTENGNYLCNNSLSQYNCIKNTYTGSSARISSGTLTLAGDWMNVDLECDLYLPGATTSERKIHYTGKLPNKCYYNRNYSAANRQRYVKWAE